MELRMSDKERKRLEKIEAVVEGRMSQEAAAESWKVSRRQVGRILRRYRESGSAGLVHRLRGRPSERKISPEIQGRVLALLEERYAGFGPTLASEKLAERDRLSVSRETVRKWMIEAGLWRPGKSGVVHRQWRERKSCTGEMVQMDTSQHAWLEGRGEEEPVLIAMIDDASSRLYARFFPTESTRSHMALLEGYLRRYGCPVAIYADRASHFQCAEKRTIADQLAGREAETQIGRALRELDIRYIGARSPQAKGRVERCFGTLQDRLVKELRLRGLSTIPAANDYLDQQFLPFWNRRFTVPPASPADLHRSLNGHPLQALLSIQETRTVANDYTIRYERRVYQIERPDISRGLRQAKITVEEWLDGTLHLRWRGRYLRHHPVPATSSRPVEMPACGQGQRPPGPQALDNSQGNGELSTVPQAQQQCPPHNDILKQPRPRLASRPQETPINRTLLLCRKEDISILR